MRIRPSKSKEKQNICQSSFIKGSDLEGNVSQVGKTGRLQRSCSQAVFS